MKKVSRCPYPNLLIRQSSKPKRRATLGASLNRLYQQSDKTFCLPFDLSEREHVISATIALEGGENIC